MKVIYHKRVIWWVWPDHVILVAILCVQVLGGVDRNDYYGDIYYTPIVKQQYYNVLFSNISVDGVMIPLECSEVSK